MTLQCHNPALGLVTAAFLSRPVFPAARPMHHLYHPMDLLSSVRAMPMRTRRRSSGRSASCRERPTRSGGTVSHAGTDRGWNIRWPREPMLLLACLCMSLVAPIAGASTDMPAMGSSFSTPRVSQCGSLDGARGRPAHRQGGRQASPGDVLRNPRRGPGGPARFPDCVAGGPSRLPRSLLGRGNAVGTPLGGAHAVYELHVPGVVSTTSRPARVRQVAPVVQPEPVRRVHHPQPAHRRAAGPSEPVPPSRSASASRESRTRFPR